MGHGAHGYLELLDTGFLPQASVVTVGVYILPLRGAAGSVLATVGRGGEGPLNMSGSGFCKVWGQLAAQTPVRGLE